jgi:hypothetical protein
LFDQTNVIRLIRTFALAPQCLFGGRSFLSLVPCPFNLLQPDWVDYWKHLVAMINAILVAAFLHKLCPQTLTPNVLETAFWTWCVERAAPRIDATHVALFEGIWAHDALNLWNKQDDTQ